MKRSKIFLLVTAALLVSALAFSGLVVGPSFIPRHPFAAPPPAYQNWEEIQSHPQPITITSYSTGLMETPLSGIMNLEHAQAADLEDELIQFPVVASLVQHADFGSYLIDAGLDASYTTNPYGTMKGLMVKRTLGRGSQESGGHIAAILERENIQLQGVWMTHLHIDHTPSILDLPKDIPYVVGENERYINFRFFMYGDHLAGLEQLVEIDFSDGVDLSPLGMGVDLLGDGSLWAISSSGHSPGHVMYFVNGVEEQVLVTGDACNTQRQFDTGIGPGTFSSDLDQAQVVLEQIIAFKAQYPQVRLVFGHE